MSVPISQFIPPPPSPLRNHKFVFYICDSISALQISSSIAALFTIAKTWKQPKCPSTDEWIKKLWNIYTMEYYSAIKK